MLWPLGTVVLEHLECGQYQRGTVGWGDGSSIRCQPMQAKRPEFGLPGTHTEAGHAGKTHHTSVGSWGGNNIPADHRLDN